MTFPGLSHSAITHSVLTSPSDLDVRFSRPPCFRASVLLPVPFRSFSSSSFYRVPSVSPFLSLLFGRFCFFIICPFFDKLIRPLSSLFSSYSSLLLVCFSASSSSRLSSPSRCLSLLLLVCLLTSFCSYILSSSPPPPESRYFNPILYIRGVNHTARTAPLLCAFAVRIFALIVLKFYMINRVRTSSFKVIDYTLVVCLIIVFL